MFDMYRNIRVLGLNVGDMLRFACPSWACGVRHSACQYAKVACDKKQPRHMLRLGCYLFVLIACDYRASKGLAKMTSKLRYLNRAGRWGRM